MAQVLDRRTPSVAFGELPGTIGYPEVVSAFSEVAAAINGETDLDTLLHLVAERICGLLGICRCSVYLVDRKNGVFRGQVGHSDRDIDSAIKRLTAGIEADGFTREILTTKRPVLIGNAQTDPRPVRAAMRDWGIRVMLGVPMVLRGDVIGLLFLDNEESPHTYTAEEQGLAAIFANLAAIAISQAQLTAQLRSTLGTAAQQNAVLRRAAALEDRLTTLLLDGANLSEIASAVTELTGKPCSIHDAAFRRLACARPSEDAAPTPLLDVGTLRSTVLRESLEGLTARRPGVIVANDASGHPHRYLLAKVCVGGCDWGYLALAEQRTRFGAEDTIVARRTATIIALELSGRQRATEAESHAIESLAHDLLQGTSDPASMARRADYHQFGLNEPHTVVLLADRKHNGVPAVSCDRVTAAFAQVAPELKTFAARVDVGIAVIVELAGASALPAIKTIVGQAIRLLAADGSIMAAVSSVCCRSEDYVEAYEQTRQISRGIQTFGAHGEVQVLGADDLGPSRLLLATADRSDADRFVRETFRALLIDGDVGSATLFLTLRVFFDCARNVRRTATRMGLHENTIRYRLTRIELATGLDVMNDGDGQLAIQLALQIMHLEGRLAPLPEQLVAQPDVKV